MHQSVRDYWLTFTTPLEGRVRWLYQDVKGWVSTGIGNKMDETAGELSMPTDDERARSLQLANEVTWDNGGVAASFDEVAAAWDAVKARLDLAPQGHRAYEGLTTLRLTDDEINRLVLGKLAQMEATLAARPEFTAFDSWPANAQLATMSMCWALGPAFRFPSFQAHVAQQNWPGAQQECTFGPHEGTIIIRNLLDQDHFRLAQVVTDNGLPFELVAHDLSSIFGVQGGLIALGHNPGGQDGTDGPSTQGGVQSFENAEGLAATGAWNDATFQATLATRLGEAGFTVVGAP